MQIYGWLVGGGANDEEILPIAGWEGKDGAPTGAR